MIFKKKHPDEEQPEGLSRAELEAEGRELNPREEAEMRAQLARELEHFEGGMEG